MTHRLSIRIPNEVLKHTDLNSRHKLLFGFICSLEMSEYGRAFASNSYFAEQFEVSTRTIQRWLAALKLHGLITVDYKRFSRTRLLRYIKTAKGFSSKFFTLVPTDTLKKHAYNASLIAGWLSSQNARARARKIPLQKFTVAKIRRNVGLQGSSLYKAIHKANELEWIYAVNTKLNAPRNWAKERYLIGAGLF